MIFFFKSKFENLKMEENESVSDFNSQLNALAQEAGAQILQYWVEYLGYIIWL